MADVPETIRHWRIIVPPRIVAVRDRMPEEWRHPLADAVGVWNDAVGDLVRLVLVVDGPDAPTGGDDVLAGEVAVVATGSADLDGAYWAPVPTANGRYLAHGRIVVERAEYVASDDARRFSTARHEVGHALGLDHSRGRQTPAHPDGDGDTVMWSVRIWGPNPNPPAGPVGGWDIERLRLLYGTGAT